MRRIKDRRAERRAAGGGLLGALLLAALLAAPAEARPQAAPAPGRDFFPVSAWYAGGQARAPMLETYAPEKRPAWRKDLEQIKALGFNTVRCWIEWTANEKSEGVYDFRTLEAVCDLAGEVGLRVIVQVYIDSAPDWVGAKHPESKFVSSNGVAIESQAAPGFCFDHPGVREKILAFFAAAARAVRDRPAFYGWDLWSEPHIINWAEVYYVGDLKNVQFCYCVSSRERFRGWLKAKYGTLDALNGAWYRTFRDWKEVDPPRFGTILTYADYIDWKEFISDKLAEDLALKARAVKAVCPRGVTTSHSATPGLFSRPDWSGTPDDRKMSKNVDYYGVSIYPKHAWTIKPWPVFMRTAGHDFIRSMTLDNGGFYIGELQAGYGVFGMKVSLPVVGDDIRDWLWTAAAYGARAINIYAYYPMSSGYESGGYGLVELDGKITERAVAAGKAAAVITRNMDLFLASFPPKARIAVLYNPLAHMVGGQQAFTGEGLSVGTNSLGESLQGVYRAFTERNLSVDFLHVMDLAPERLASYKLLVVPYPVQMARAHLAALVEYVRSGGTLVTEARCGWVDERGFSTPIIPGGGLHEVLGCRESRLAPLAKTGTMTITAADEALPLLKAGDKLDTIFFEEGFELAGGTGRVLARLDDGTPAAVAASFGKGRAIIVGSFLGLAYHHFKNPANGRFYAGLADWLGIPAGLGVETSDPGVFVEGRLLESPQARLLFAFNRGEKPAEAVFRVSLPWPSAGATDLETGEKAPLERQGDKATLKTALPVGGVRVFVLRPAGRTSGGEP